MNRVAAILLAMLLAVGLAAAIFALQFNRFLEAPVNVADSGENFVIRPGMSVAAISDSLYEKGIIDQPRYFGWYARFTDQAASVQAGEYRIEYGATPRSLLKKFVRGEVKLYSFTIVEGWNIRELLAALASNADIEQTLVYEDWPALLESIGSDASHPEGLFLPETYRFPKSSTDADVLRQAYTLMQATLAEEWASRRADLPIDSPYEALILASIIEKETALASERPQIAGVFVRRLQLGMRLQTDPTVIYGIGVDFNGNLTRRDLRTDTPYNTYTRRGLPPTPIALPGRAAIRAALNPADGSALYFVATGLGDGSHKFSDTIEEHERAVQEYLARQRAARQGGQD